MSTASLMNEARQWRDGLTAIRGSLICAAILVFLDVVFHGSFLYSVLVCPVWFLVAIIRAVMLRPRIQVAVARLLVPFATMLLVLANDRLQEQIALVNAAHVIEACERYREASGAYPKRLEDLVPRYVSGIPRAKYCLVWGHFDYSEGERSHLLYWYAVPPFGRRIYSFERRTWSFLD
jgi:hypothetical protein